MRPTRPVAVFGLALLLPLLGMAQEADHGISIKLDRAVLHVKRWPSIKEPPVPVVHNGLPLKQEGGAGTDRFNLIEISDQTSGTQDYPLINTDLVSNLYFRTTYQKREGPGARLGTSVVGSPSFRTPAGLQYLPEVLGADLQTGGPERIVCRVSAEFRDPLAEILSIRSYPQPEVGRTEAGLSVRFRSRRDMTLDRAQRGRDAFRLLTVASMFSDDHIFDANVVRYEDSAGRVRVVRLANDTGRDAYLLPLGTELGRWFELAKEPGSTWFPDSPTIRIEVGDRKQVPGRLGLQGFLAGTRDPNGDSLSVWVEWLDAPEVVPAETALRLDVRVIATPPSRVTE